MEEDEEKNAAIKAIEDLLRETIKSNSGGSTKLLDATKSELADGALRIKLSRSIECESLCNAVAPVDGFLESICEATAMQLSTLASFGIRFHIEYIDFAQGSKREH